MFVRYICYPVNVLGPGRRLGVWLSGCKKCCPDCMSVDLQTRVTSDWVCMDSIKRLIGMYSREIEGVTISGGEPFDQPEELLELVDYVYRFICDDILVFTGYTWEELAEIPFSAQILESVSTVIAGPYISALDSGIGLRGSSNQTIHDKRQKFDFANAERSVQSFVFGERIFMAGLKQ